VDLLGHTKLDNMSDFLIFLFISAAVIRQSVLDICSSVYRLGSELGQELIVRDSAAQLSIVALDKCLELLVWDVETVSDKELSQVFLVDELVFI